jgi:putative DNA primase/helicase
MIKLARHHVHVDQDQLDRDDMLLNADGVTINLSDGTTKPNDPSDFCTKITRATYDPDTKCPLFLAFLDRIMGGSEPLKSYLQRAVGYSLTGNMEESCFFIAHGSGANGKSVFLNLIRDLAGAYGQNMAMSTLMQKSNSGQIPSDLARLPGIRIVTAIEGEENQKLAESTVKQLTGGDMITARHLFKKWFDFKPKLKIWMATNFRPKVSGEDQAMWRRIHLVPFNVVIPAEERDGKLPEKLREEFPGILNWAIEGAKQWRQMGLQPPKEVTDATSEYQHEMDTFSRFCSDTIIRKAGAMTGKTQALNSYNEWRKIEGGEELTLKSFRDKMLRLGYEEDRKGNLRFWKDVEFISHDPVLEDIELRD